MAKQSDDLILIVEHDPVIGDVISHQVLESAGYKTCWVQDASSAIKFATEHSPSAIIADLDLPGLSGKDLMIMLQAAEVDRPVIVLARKGSEMDVIQAFRLGAVDYLLWPMREPEIIVVIERVLKQVHSRRERERMESQIQEANQQLQRRVNELTTISSIGKMVISITDQSLLFEKILESVLQVTQAEIGWFLLRDEATRAFLLVYHRNLPDHLAAHLHKPWDDGISILVAKAGKGLLLHGEPLQRFKISELGQSVLMVPVKAQNQVIGVLVAMHRENKPFGESEKFLVEAVADYASISLVNARMFLAIEERLRSLQVSEKKEEDPQMSREMLRDFNREQGATLELTMDTLEQLARVPATNWTAQQRQALSDLQTQVQKLIRIAEATAPLTPGQPATPPARSTPR